MTRTLLALCGLCLPIFAADFTTYVGDGYENRTSAMATDAAGNTYLTGTRRIPTPGGEANASTTDIFVTKVDALGKIVFTATFSGKSNDTASGIAVDSVGNMFVVGSTTSVNFPLQGALQTTPGQEGPGFGTGFLIKLNAAGSLLFSTYFGGTRSSSQLTAVAVDQAGDVYVTGSTYSQDYQRTPGLPAGTVVRWGPGATSGAIFAKISAQGDRLIYAGVISGTQRACSGGSSCFLSVLGTGGVAIGVDAAGNAFVAGNSGALDLPATPGALVPKGLGAFVFKVNADGKSLGYLTYLSSTLYGGSAKQTSTTVRALVADSSGNVYLTGETADPNFPVTAGVFQPVYSITVPDLLTPPARDAFVAKLKPDGTGMNWATYLGVAEHHEEGTALTVDSAGAVYVAGNSSGPREFVAKLDSLGTSAQTGIQPMNTSASGIALGTQGRIQQAGGTGILASVESLFSGTRLFGPTNAANGVLTGRLAPGEIMSLYGEALGPASPISATPITGSFPTMLGETQVTIGGVSAPLLYVSPTQINTIVPNGSVPGTSVAVRILVRGELRAEFRAVIVAADPQLFRSPTGSIAAINEDGTINSAANPAAWGSFVAVWATGAGSFPGLDGQIATDAESYCSCSILKRDIFPGTSLPVVYSGSSPGLVNGAVQVNFRLPTGSGTTSLPIMVGVRGSFSEVVPIFVKP